MKKHTTQIRSGFATTVMLAWLTAAPANLPAATLTVTNIEDTGPGTLRAALQVADNGDTINFALAAPARIALTNRQLYVTKSVSILGPGADNLFLDGNALDRVF